MQHRLGFGIPHTPLGRRHRNNMHLRTCLVRCHVKDELVSQLIGLNNKLDMLSPELVHGDLERAEVQRQRESLYTEIKRHNAKGHAGKAYPAAERWIEF